MLKDNIMWLLLQFEAPKVKISKVGPSNLEMAPET